VPNRLSERLVHTIGRSDDLADLASRVARPRVVLEGRTSMGRSGMPPEELTALDAAARRWSGDDRVRVLGHALHLPLGEGHQAEVDGWLAAAPATTWFVSHLTAAELDELRRKHPGVTFRPRIGTRLWLGDAAALHPKATVVDARPVSRGERVGYRQQRLRRSGTVLVVSGGTSHGIGLEAPRAITSSRQRARALVRGGLESAGMALSPFTIAGRQRWFVEPPHMQVSLVFLPDDVTPPRPGDQLDVAVRYTTTIFDAVHLS
jgi:hypothetical protein